MHLTFVSSDGLEQSALSFLAASSDSSDHSEMLCDNYDSSDEHGGFLVVDENSPLLLDLDPPGTTSVGYVSGKRKKRSLLSFRIKKAKNERLPWVIGFTAL